MCGDMFLSAVLDQYTHMAWNIIGEITPDPSKVADLYMRSCTTAFE